MVKKRSLLAGVIAFFVCVSAFGGCGKKAAPDSAATGDFKPGEITYPIETDVTLTYWMQNFASYAYTSMGDTPFAKMWREKTGINVTFIHPPQGQLEEKFNLLLSSGELPDIIEWNWYSILGGPEKAIKDGYITRLNDYMDYAPSFRKTIEEDYPQYAKMLKSDEGSYYSFPQLRPDPVMAIFYGPIVRKDWLDDLALGVPETIDEWYEVLKAFKDEKGADAPFTAASLAQFTDMGAFIGAYGGITGFFVEDGKIKYGVLEDGYKEGVALLNKWYKEGLIDKNIGTMDPKALDAKMLNGNSGATYGYNSAYLGKWLTAGSAEGYNLVPAKYPALTKGATAKFGQLSYPFEPTNAAAVSARSRNKELAVRLLDYAYSEEGHMLFSFGFEGETYKMENGEPVFTDLVLKNPEGLTVDNVLSSYTRAVAAGPYPYDSRAFVQTYPFPQQKQAFDLWGATDQAKHQVPRISLSVDENDVFKEVMTEITPLVEEQTLKFVMGVEPLENIDAFTAQLRSLGIERAIAARQAALDRYESIE